MKRPAWGSGGFDSFQAPWWPVPVHFLPPDAGGGGLIAPPLTSTPENQEDSGIHHGRPG